MQRLAGQVGIVTGGGTGIGAATARRLAEEGARVLIAEIDPESAARQVATIRAAGGTAEAVRVDVGRSRDLNKMVQTAVEHWGRLDILVNNAYERTPSGGAVEITEKEWDRGMSVLVKAHFLAAKFAIPEMRKGAGGSIVNLASVHGLLMAPRWMIYEAGKSAVIGLTRQLATEYGPDGIRVNAICPGHIVTERQEEAWKKNPSGLRFFEQQYPLRRCGRPLDIANAIVFLCSEEASFITGHSLVVDGGMTVQLQENVGVHLGHHVQEHPTTLPY